MGGLIGITQPDWSRAIGPQSAHHELERYARHEFGDRDVSWLFALASRVEAAHAGCEHEPHGDRTLFARLAHAVASFF